MGEMVYIVKWIEIEFGERDEGYKIFLYLEDCIQVSKLDSERGAYQGGYCGPQRPIGYYETSWECLEEKTQESLRHAVNAGEGGIPWAFSTKQWEPHLKSEWTSIE